MKKRILSLVLAMAMIMSMGMTLREEAAQDDLPPAVQSSDPAEEQGSMEPPAGEEPPDSAFTPSPADPSEDEGPAEETPAVEEASPEDEMVMGDAISPTSTPGSEEAAPAPMPVEEEGPTPTPAQSPQAAEPTSAPTPTPTPAAADGLKIQSIFYHEIHSPIQAAYANAKKVFAIAVTKGSKYEDYTCELTVGGHPVTLSYPHQSQSSYYDYWWWDGVQLSQAGEYTMTVTKNSEPRSIATNSVKIYKVTFDPGEGHFADMSAGEKLTAYGVAESRWDNYGLPSSPTKDDEGDFNGFLGWSTASGGSTYKDLINTAGEAGGSLDVTVHAVYGEQRIWRFEVQDANGRKVNDSDELDLGSLSVDGAGVSLTVMNTGSQVLDNIVFSVSSPFKVDETQKKALNKGESYNITIGPKEGTGNGTYSCTIWVFGYANSQRKYSSYLMVKMNVTGSGEVTVKPSSIVKNYGEIKSAADVTVTCEPGRYQWSQLNATLDSQGFHADAPVGEYGYTVSGGDGYQITVDQTAKVKVDPAAPRNDGVNAAGAHLGQTLAASKLSGTFTNPYTSQTVTGDLTWDNADTPLNELGSHQYSWTFKPTGADEGNYTIQHGTATVQVSELETTIITLTSETTTFTYNARPQGLTFSANRAGAITVTYKPKEGGEWSETQPTDAGVYSVRAVIAASGKYAADDHDETMTIEQAVLKPSWDINVSKIYDGNTDAKVNRVWPRALSGDEVTLPNITASYDSEKVGNRVITITYGDLDGRDAANYRLVAPTSRDSGRILPKKVTITAKPITKQYGADLTLTAEHFEASGLVNGEQLKDQPVEYVSAGTDPAAAAGTYNVTAAITGGNYSIGSSDKQGQAVTVGTMTVEKVTPVASLAGVHAGDGCQGGSLQDVDLYGTFVNPNNSAMVAEGTLAWVKPDTTLPEGQTTFSAGWKFTPADTKNYEDEVTGTVTITLVSKEKPLPKVTASSKTVTYNGQAQGIDAPVVDAEYKNKVSCEVEYRLRKDVAASVRYASAAAEDPHDTFTTQEPTDAGTYDVHVHVYVLPEYQDRYADTLLQPTLIITPAKPDVEDVTAEPVEEGTTLSEVKLSGAKGVDGQKLSGTYIWDNPGDAVTEEGEHRWTFLPDDANYSSVTGSTRLTLAESTQTIQAVVYNLPGSLGYEDYAVVNVQASGLKAGDEIVFYKQYGDELHPECAPTALADPTAAWLKVPLDEDALDAGGGSLQVQVINHANGVESTVTYPAEMDFTVANFLTLKVGESAALTIAPAEGYSPSSYSVTANADDLVSVEKGDTSAAQIKGIRAGSTTLEVSVTFHHADAAGFMDGSIAMTKTVNIVVEETASSPTPAPTMPTPTPTQQPSQPGGPSVPSQPSSAPSPTPEPGPGSTPEPNPEPSTEPAPEPTASPVPEQDGLVTEEDGSSYVYENGEKQTGFVDLGDAFYYCSSDDGHVLRGGWVRGKNNTRYYAQSSGKLYTGVHSVDGKNYYFSVKGAHLMKGGWVRGEKEARYYAQSSGELYTGVHSVDGKNYYFSVKDSHLMKGGWVRGAGTMRYYAQSSGELLTGRHIIGGKGYYFSVKDGHMMYGGWANAGGGYRYKLDKNGVIIDAVTPQK